jgi:RNA polymerase sigma-70 factor (ECF subfamily)
MRAPRRLDADRPVEHLPRLYRAARAWTRSREEAEDLVQETYARVLARPRLLLGEDELGYLLRALRNTLISQLRTQQRRPASTELADETALGTRASDDPAQATETRSR